MNYMVDLGADVDAEGDEAVRPMTQADVDEMEEGSRASPLGINKVNGLSEMMTASEVKAMYAAWVANRVKYYGGVDPYDATEGEGTDTERSNETQEGGEEHV